MNEIFRILGPNDFTPEIMEQVISLGIRSGTWQDSDVEYYNEQFLNPRNINIVCQNEEGIIMGHVLARPHNDVVQDYLDRDPVMAKSDIEMFYFDHVNIDETVSGKFLGMRLILEMLKEANRRGVFRFSGHVRVINGLSKNIQQKFGKGVAVIRRIEEYVDCNNEPFDYMEINITL